jgi:hypothetical protein
MIRELEQVCKSVVHKVKSAIHHKTCIDQLLWEYRGGGKYINQCIKGNWGELYKTEGTGCEP